MRQLERHVLLNVIDRKWREHLYEMDYLKEGIGLRAMAQRDPLVEYQREGYDMFIGMLDGHQGGVGRLPVQRHRSKPRPRRAVAPVAAPEGLAEFAAAAAAKAQDSAVATKERPAPAGMPARRRRLRAKGIERRSAAADLHRAVRGRVGAGATATAAASMPAAVPAPVGGNGVKPRVSRPRPPRAAAGGSSRLEDRRR